jgi:hypothetical protein
MRLAMICVDTHGRGSFVLADVWTGQRGPEGRAGELHDDVQHAAGLGQGVGTRRLWAGTSALTRSTPAAAQQL